MSANSKIEWTDATWNPTRGCSRVSEGCRHCYAEQIAARFSGSGLHSEGFARRVDGEARWTGRVELVPGKLDEPLRWRRPQRIFVNSMSDLFHESLSDEAIDQVLAVMLLCRYAQIVAGKHGHTFQILTKRPIRMRDYFSHRECRVRLLDAAHDLRPLVNIEECEAVTEWPLPNVWKGTSVEDQATADQRIPLLLQTPAVVRFVSYEPALGPVDFSRFLGCGHRAYDGDIVCPKCSGIRELDHFLDWVIFGGESGHRARPVGVSWARSTVLQCRAAKVACFIKQLGANVLADPPITLRDRKGGDPSEWPEDLRVREFPNLETTK